MYKMIIVDDEQAIRQGIAHSIPWEAWGFAISGLYANGQEALESIRREPPDVVLSDIRMPKMDGVELMQVLSREFPQVHVIILSGYSDFEYLNMSIRNNVMEYLLKPTDVDEFEQTFRRIRQKLDAERQKAEEYNALVEVRHEHWLNNLLDGYAVEDADGISRELEQAYGCHFENCMVLHLVPDGGQTWEDKVLYRMKKDIVKCCDPIMKNFGGLCLLTGDKSVAAVASRSADQDLDEGYVKQCVLRLQRDVEDALGVTVSAGISTLCTEADMLPYCNEQAKCCALQIAGFGKNGMLFYAQHARRQQHQTASFQLENLKSALLGGMAEGVERTLDAAFVTFAGSSAMEHRAVDQSCLETLLALSQWLLQYNIRLEQVMNGLGVHYHDIGLMDSLAEKKTFMRTVLQGVREELARGMGAKQKNSTAYLIRQCIDRYYTSNLISLEFVAEKVEKSPVYISKVFKSQFDCNFSEYLMRRRMEKSRELLETGRLKVYEIAQSVGYADTSNFIRVFRKYFGYSPKEYQASVESNGIDI